MQQFFVEPSQVGTDSIIMEGSDVSHMKQVLRMKAGDDVMISDGEGNRYLCCIDRYEEGKAVLNLLKALEEKMELPSEIYLFQGLPKGEKMEWIVQKAVELGAAGVIPFAARRSVVRLDEKKARKKQTRWQAIAKGAAEQSGRDRIPEVSEVQTWKKALESASQLDLAMIPYELECGMEKTSRLVETVGPGMRIGVMIGPEGGFEEAEIEEARQAGIHPISLGKRILRTETAGITALSILMYHLESKAHNL